MKTWIWWPCRLACRIYFTLFHRRRILGREGFPPAGAVLVLANHASFLDPPFVGSATPRLCYFLARSSLASIPLFGRLLRAVGVHFVDREGSARAGLARAIESLEAGEVLCMFPEGTRSSTGEVGAFRSGALLVLRRVPVPVVPAGVRGTFRAWPRTRKLPRPVRCAVHFGPPMSAAEVLAPGGFEELRRRIAELAGSPLAPATPRGDDPSEGSDGGARPFPVGPFPISTS
ncbi:MAG: 1-acyl-sn-glycerol-3-phosphate acyltransferase [Planctomycetes bacterium]|nr:1-acyl-sn-glycerol-3-phosphate acyltransferase [Planctomycetota bacterium]